MMINKFMFKENKYSQIYYNIISNAKSRNLDGYTEKHHIVPKSLGGTDDANNLAILTAKEHYICHLLLPKMTEGVHYQKMIYAFTIMSGRKIYGSRKYAFYKEEYAKINSQLRSGEGNGMWGVDRSGNKNTFYGKKHSAESLKKMSENRKGHSWNKGIPKSAEHKKKISDMRKRVSAKYIFNHPEFGQFTGTTGDLGRAHNIRTSEVYKLVKGEYKTYKGWKYVNALNV